MTGKERVNQFTKDSPEWRTKERRGGDCEEVVVSVLGGEE